MAHVVIYIPGLADRFVVYRIGQRIPIKMWRVRHNMRTRYFAAHWDDRTESFEAKKRRLFSLIDTEVAKGHAVSLVAASAGASLAVVALKQHGKVSKAVSICGKLRNPQTVSQALYELNPAFKTAITTFTQLEPSLTPAERSNILHVQPRQDSLVPVGDNYIQGARITTIPTAGHVISIVCALLFFSRRIVKFVRG